MRVWTLGVAAFLIAACETTPAVPDGAVDSEDAGAVTAQDAAMPTPPSDVWTALDVSWRVGWISATLTDSVSAPVLDGTFTYPDTPMAYGVEWENAMTNEGGELLVDGVAVAPRSGTLYAVARVTLAEGQHLVVQPDRFYAVHAGAHRQPGDVYGSGAFRVPLPLSAGEHLIVLRSFGGRSAPRVRLWTTEAELAFNPNDRTVPDWVVNEMSTQFLGIAVLDLTGRAPRQVRAQVLENEFFQASEIILPSIPAGAATQVPFELRPRVPFVDAEQTVVARLRIEADGLFGYETEVEMQTVGVDAPYRRTFRSAIDGSAQYYGVRPPTAVSPDSEYALVLSLHGASVQAIGQARSYAAKDWAYIIAPTNRRPFGFDWEVFGRLDALEVLAHARSTFRIDATRVYLTGHSMGGHGTWQLGTLFPDRFAVVGPSAGWRSFYTYGGARRPSFPFSRSRASSDTEAYVQNLADRAVYILHGDADDNVPVSEARAMRSLLEPVVSQLEYYEEPGAGHWWDGERSAGVDCVDWPPLFERMQATRLNPHELDFEFRSPSPWVSARHSYVHLRSATTPAEDLRVRSEVSAGVVTLSTENVRSMVLDGAALMGQGVTEVIVDGASYAVSGGEIEVGPQTGKRPGQHGPFHDAFERPFCFLYDDNANAYRTYASWLASTWANIGNGLACAMPVTRFDATLAERYQPIYLGVRSEGNALPFAWDTRLRLGEQDEGEGLILFVQPEGAHLAGYIATTPGQEELLYSVPGPFGSRSEMPDYVAFNEDGLIAAGFFDAEWNLDASLAVGLSE